MKHEGQAFDNEIEMPSDHPIHLSLSMAAAIDDGSAHFGLGVTIEPFIANWNERSEGGGRTGVKNRSDVNHSRDWAVPLEDGSSWASWSLP